MYESFQNNYDESFVNNKKYLCYGNLIVSVFFMGFVTGYQSYNIPHNYCNISNF